MAANQEEFQSNPGGAFGAAPDNSHNSHYAQGGQYQSSSNAGAHKYGAGNTYDYDNSILDANNRSGLD